MRRILVKEIKEDMVLARPVYTLEGAVLLKAGTKLDISKIKRILRLNIKYAYIEDNISKDIYFEDAVSEEIRLETKNFIENTMKCLNKYSGHIDKSIFDKVNQIVSEICSKKEVLYNLDCIRSKDDYLYGHSVNVCILSTLLAKSMSYNDAQLKHLALGALLHDVGKAFVDKKYHFYNDNFTVEEEEMYRSYVRLGYETIKRLECGSMLAANIALSHNERYDGTGFPFNKTGTDIHEYVRIVSLVNEYDNIRNSGEFSNNSLALENLLSLAYSVLDPNLLRIFSSIIAPYPIGTLVELNDGRIALVESLNPSMLSRPVLRIVNLEKNIPLDSIDLIKNLNVIIKGEFKDEK